MTRLEAAWAAYQAEPCSHNRRAWLAEHHAHMEALHDAEEWEEPRPSSDRAALGLALLLGALLAVMCLSQLFSGAALP